MTRREYLNIIITGTPGCGKSSHAANLVSQLKEPYKHFSISDLAKERKCIESYDETLDTSVVDEDNLLDSLETDLENGGILIDWHCCDIFPERLIDLVVVLRTDNKILFDRLNKRGYKENKVQENLDCEIMEVILQDAKESYIPEIVIELNSNSAEEMDENVDRLIAWAENWKKDHQDGVSNELDPEAAAEAQEESEDDDAEEIEEEDEDEEEKSESD